LNIQFEKSKSNRLVQNVLPGATTLVGSVRKIRLTRVKDKSPEVIPTPLDPESTDPTEPTPFVSNVTVDETKEILQTDYPQLVQPEGSWKNPGVSLFERYNPAENS